MDCLSLCPFLRRHQMSDSTQEILKVSRLSPGFRENFSYASNAFSTVSSPLISTYLQPGELQHMAGGQALVCGIQLILMVFLPPFPSLPFASLTLSSRAAVRQRRRQPENFSGLLWLTAGKPLGLDERPQPAVTRRGSQAHRCTASDR